MSTGATTPADADPGTPVGVRGGATVPAAGRWAYHGGHVVPLAEIALAPTTQALNYGTGVFEGIRAYRRRDTGTLAVFRLRDHLQRLADSADALRIDLGRDVEELRLACLDLLARNAHPADAYLRPLAYKLALEPGTPFGVRLTGVSSQLSITSVAMGSYLRRDGIRCALSTWRRVPAASMPAKAKIVGGYVTNALAVDQSRESGCDDAILLGIDGFVAEASTANVFAVLDGQLCTPPLSADILDGITRRTVIELAAAEQGLVTVQRSITPQELLDADEVFLTGTGVEVVPVIAVGDRVIGDGRPGPLTGTLVDLYQRVVRGGLPAYHAWLDEV